MYERLIGRRKDKRDTSLGVLLLICAGIAAVVIGGIVWACLYYPRYMKFIGKLSDSTVYAYENGSLQAEQDGETIRVSGENVYGLYNYIMLNEIGKVVRELPEEPAAAVLDYGDGSRLLLWDVESSDSRKATDLLLAYEDQEGYHYYYVNNKMDLATIRRYFR